MENDEPQSRLRSGIFRSVDVRYEDLPVSEIAASGQGVPSRIHASLEKIAEWDHLERTFEDLSRRVKQQAAVDPQGTFRELQERFRQIAYEPSFVGGQLDRKNLRMYEWQRGELYIHSAALILDPETTLEIAYEPEGRLKRLLLESGERNITYLEELPRGISQEQADAVAVWRFRRGKGLVPESGDEFLEDLADVYLEPFREALATRRRFIEEYGIQPYRIRLSYDDQPYEVNYAQTKFRRSHVHAIPVIRRSPLDARESIAASMRGTGDFGERREARARAVAGRVMGSESSEPGFPESSKYALLWVRDNRDQGAFMDTKPEILKQTIEVLRVAEPDRKLFLIGDDLFRGRPELLSAFQEEGILEGVDKETLIRFWEAEKNDGKALTHGEQALFLHYLNVDADIVQVGIESGALESAICLGVPTVYFQAREHVADKGTRWQLYWAQWSFGETRVAEGADGSKKFFASGRPVKLFDRSGEVYPPALMSVRRVEFGPDLPEPADVEAEPITVYYPAKITVGIDQVSTLVENGGLIDMARAFDQEWSDQAWRASEYFADQIHRWALVETSDWEVAARRYEAITHSLRGLVHPMDEGVRRSYESAGHHLAGPHGPESVDASAGISAAYAVAPPDRGTAVTAALHDILSDKAFQSRCIHDLRIARLTAPEQAKLASSVKEVTAANNILRAIGRVAPDGSPTTSRHIAGALSVQAGIGQSSSLDRATLDLLADAELDQHQTDLATAAAALNGRVAATKATAQALAARYHQDGGAAVARLTAAGAAPELIERARAAAAEDVIHARRTALAAQSQLSEIRGRIQQVAQEAERRSGLTPLQRAVEQAARQQRVRHHQGRSQQAPPDVPKITGTKGPARKGPSL